MLNTSPPNVAHYFIETVKKKGYVWPDPDGIGLSLSQYYQPKGYQKLTDGKAQICQTLAEMQRFVGEWMLTNKKAPWATMARHTQRKQKVGGMSIPPRIVN